MTVIFFDTNVPTALPMPMSDEEIDIVARLAQEAALKRYAMSLVFPRRGAWPMSDFAL